MTAHKKKHKSMATSLFCIYVAVILVCNSLFIINTQYYKYVCKKVSNITKKQLFFCPHMLDFTAEWCGYKFM